MDRFWLVWNPNGNAPRFKHETESSARQEAERLARLHSGETFILLEAVAAVKKPEPPVQWEELIDPDEVPL